MKILRDFLGVFAVILAVGVIASFCFFPMAEVSTPAADGTATDVAVSGLELSFGSDLTEDVNNGNKAEVFKSGWFFISFFTAIFTAIFTVLGFKFMKSYGAAVLFGLINSIIILVIICSRPSAFADFGSLTVLAANYTPYKFLLLGTSVGATVVAAAAALVKDAIIVAESNGTKKTIPQRVIRFFREYKSELKKVIWPGPRSVVKNTLVVLLVCAVVLLIVWLVDAGMGELFRLVFNSTTDTASAVASAVTA